MTPFASAIVRAIQQQTLFTELNTLRQLHESNLSEDDLQLYEQATTARAEIIARCAQDIKALQQCWDQADIDYQIDRASLENKTPQFHAFSAIVAAQQLELAVSLAERQGYRLPIPTDRAGWQALRRLGQRVAMTHTNADTARLTLAWTSQSSWLQRLAPNRLRPTLADAERADWPALFWPAALAVRPLRKLLRTLPGQTPVTFGEWLGTPAALIPDLLTLAGLSSEDTLVDLGCGDGRVLIEAASRYGCKAQGVEQDADLCALGRTQVERLALSDLVRIEHGDAGEFGFEHATVIFLFIPVQHLQQLFPRFWQTLQPGSRIIVHEQRPLQGLPPPTRSTPVIAAGALTVAHLWTK
ncbi:MAG: cyclopropane-fatty-acyl-phospholipid synthase family protein [Pseudomonadales bacterium]